MKCRDFDRAMEAFISGDLPPARMSEMESHRYACLRCREQHRQWEALSIGARQLPRVTAPAGFEAALMRRIRAREHRRWRYLIFDFPRPLVRAAAYATLTLIVGLSAFLLRSGYFSAGESPGVEYQTAGEPALTQPAGLPAEDAAASQGYLGMTTPREREWGALPAIPIRSDFRNYAVPQDAEYVDYLLKGTGNREVYVRLPRTIIYSPPADNDLYYVRNISH